VNKLLVASFPDIFNVEFTASMEERLDEIVEGKATYLELLNSFYNPFEKDLSKAKKEMKNIKAAEESTSIKCDSCGKQMVIKWGRNGKFLACSGYPECRNTTDFKREEDGTIKVLEEEKPDEVCEKCGLPMVLKRGRYGQFLACSGYPDCRNTRKLNGSAPQPKKAPKQAEGAICPECGGPMVFRKNRWGGEFLSCASYPKCKGTRPVSSGMPCPEAGCEGEVVERRSRRGKKFFGCSRYPDCEFTSWNRPLPEPCPLCGSPYLEEKYSKKDGKLKACPQKSCKFKEKLAD
jgi:DNA topoisomerase-1